MIHFVWCFYTSPGQRCNSFTQVNPNLRYRGLINTLKLLSSGLVRKGVRNVIVEAKSLIQIRNRDVIFLDIGVNSNKF